MTRRNRFLALLAFLTAFALFAPRRAKASEFTTSAVGLTISEFGFTIGGGIAQVITHAQLVRQSDLLLANDPDQQDLVDALVPVRRRHLGIGILTFSRTLPLLMSTAFIASGYDEMAIVGLTIPYLMLGAMDWTAVVLSAINHQQTTAARRAHGLTNNDTALGLVTRDAQRQDIVWAIAGGILGTVEIVLGVAMIGAANNGSYSRAPVRLGLTPGGLRLSGTF